MLSITIPAQTGFNDDTSEFVTFDEVVLELEHSLASVAIWESQWEKPFLGAEAKSNDETLSYIRAMTLTRNVPDESYHRLSASDLDSINAYIGAKMTATWFNDVVQKSGPREVITAEVIYYWMITLNIPFECQTWHLNRLLTLVKVINSKNAPKKKMGKADIARQQAELNARRRAELNTRG